MLELNNPYLGDGEALPLLLHSFPVLDISLVNLDNPLLPPCSIMSSLFPNKDRCWVEPISPLTLLFCRK